MKRPPLISPDLSHVLLAAGGLALGLLPGAALGGDGSGTDNPGLLRGAYQLGCDQDQSCVADVPVLQDAPVSQTAPGLATRTPANCQALWEMGLTSPDCPLPTAAGTQAATSSVPPPAVASGPPAVPPPAPDLSETVKLGWSLGLRGSFKTVTGLAPQWRMGVAPELSLTHNRVGGTTKISGQSELYTDPGGKVGVGATSLDLSADQALSMETRLSGSASLGLTQEDETATVTNPAYVLSGSATAGADRRFGRLSLGVSGLAERKWVTETGDSGGGWTSNAYRSYAGLGGSVRGSYKLTPILSLTGQGSAEHFWYDAADPVAGVKRDGYAYTLRGGLAGKWPFGLSASAYGGYGWRTYDAAGLNTVGGWIYGASLVYDSPLGPQFGVTFDNTISAADAVAGANAEIARTLSANARLPLNPWLVARASASAGWTSYSGSTNTETSYGAGAGLDVLLARNLTLSADYAYSYDDSSSSGQTQTHTVTAGVSVSR